MLLAGKDEREMTTAFKLTSAYRRVLDRVSREPGQLQRWSFPLVDRPRVEELVSRGLLEVIKNPVKEMASTGRLKRLASPKRAAPFCIRR